MTVTSSNVGHAWFNVQNWTFYGLPRQHHSAAVVVVVVAVVVVIAVVSSCCCCCDLPEDT